MTIKTALPVDWKFLRAYTPETVRPAHFEVLDNDGDLVATMLGNQESDAATARLFAASPDLLDALQALLRAPSIGSSGPGSVTIEVQTFNLNAARDAVARATRR